jgi:hypothetical protein
MYYSLLSSAFALLIIKVSVFSICDSAYLPPLSNGYIRGTNDMRCGQRFFKQNRESASDDDTAMIVGGNDAAPGEFPFVVSLTQGFSDTHFCGGSVISQRHVMTAAHCLQK